MKRFLAGVGPMAGNFIAWWLLARLPMNDMMRFVLVIASTGLILHGMMYLNRPVDKDKAAQSKSLPRSVAAVTSVCRSSRIWRRFSSRLSPEAQ